MREPLRPLLGGNGQIVREDVKYKRLQLVERLEGNVRDGMPDDVVISVQDVFRTSE